MAACVLIAKNGGTVYEAGVPADQCTGFVILEPAEYAHYQALYQASVAPYDYLHGGAIWSFFFAFTLSLWLVARSAGTIIEAVRKF